MRRIGDAHIGTGKASLASSARRIARAKVGVSSRMIHVIVSSCPELYSYFGPLGAIIEKLSKYILEILQGCLGPKRQINRPSRCHGWIGARKLPLVDLPRAPTDFWDPFSDVVLGTLQIAPSDLGAQ